jgi:hypothetical protein
MLGLHLIALNVQQQNLSKENTEVSLLKKLFSFFGLINLVAVDVM